MTTSAQTREPLLSVRGLTKHFPLTRGILFKKAVGHVRAGDGDDVDPHPGGGLDGRHPDRDGDGIRSRGGCPGL